MLGLALAASAGRARPRFLRYLGRARIEVSPQVLAVGRLLSVFALVVMFAYVGWDSICRRFQQHSPKRQPRNIFEHISVFHGFGGRFPPGKWRVAGNENARYGNRIEALGAEALNDDRARVAHIGL